MKSPADKVKVEGLSSSVLKQVHTSALIRRLIVWQVVYFLYADQLAPTVHDNMALLKEVRLTLADMLREITAAGHQLGLPT